jgi:hypothetical protein
MDHSRTLPIASALLLLLALGVLSAGCSPPPPPEPAAAPPGVPGEVTGQVLALQAVLDSYGAPAGTAPPGVLWVADLDCPGGTAWRWSDGRCVRGVFQPASPGTVSVARWPGALLPQVSLAHETLHWLLFATTGDGNEGHTGDFYDRVAAADQRLWDMVDSGLLR